MKIIAGFLFCILSFCSIAQVNHPETSYPQHYFRNPLNIPIFLAGNFGECRPGHFHSGMDIKTLGEENQPVYAAADGYISRIKMENGGFGHALYITHPNGYSTLYAHLNNFAPAIQHYLHSEQYKQQKWDVDIQLSPSQFPVKKGEQIAWSGNTGASTAPHLHFEIRDSKTEHPLNGELFGLPLIDTKPPLPTSIAIYDMAKSIYEQEPGILALQNAGTTFRPRDDTLVINNNLLGIGVNVNDYMNGSDNTIAFYSSKLYLDDTLQAEVILDDIGYDITRFVNAYADYKTHELKDQWYQCMFQLPGNKLQGIYHYLNNRKGAVTLHDKLLHKIKLVIKDDNSNVSIIAFYLRSLQLPSENVPCPVLFKRDQPNAFSDPNVSFNIDANTLYDDICFKFSSKPDSNAFSDRYSIHYSYVPLQHSFELNIKPDKPVPFALRNKVALIYNDGKSDDGRAAWYKDEGWYKATVRNFGTYRLVADTTAPVIKPLAPNGANLSTADKVVFTVRDAVTSVKRFKGELDGKWICMEQHRDLFFYHFDEYCGKGNHELVFTAADENNNTQTIYFRFTR